MSNVIAILTNVIVTPEELLVFILGVGGYEIPSMKGGHLMQGKGHVWIFINNEELPVLLNADSEERKQILAKLGTEPRTCILVDFSSRDESHKLAIDFAWACTQRWPCIVDTFDPAIRVYSKEEIVLLRAEGKTFAELDTD